MLMKRLVAVIQILVLAALPALAQKPDFSSNEIIARSGNVQIVVKDNYYRMVVGALERPSKAFLLGYSGSHAAQTIEGLLDAADDDHYTRTNRQICFCGMGLLLTIDGAGENENYTFVDENGKARFNLSRHQLLAFRDALEK